MVNDDIKQSDTSKIKFTTAINFMSSKNNKKEGAMHSKSDNIEIMSHNKADKAIKKLMINHCVNLLYCKCHEINFNRGGWYKDSPDCIKNKKATINSINKNDEKCFHYAVTVALNQKEIKIESERISKINTFISKYDWKRKDD